MLSRETCFPGIPTFIVFEHICQTQLKLLPTLCGNDLNFFVQITLDESSDENIQENSQSQDFEIK